MNLDGLLVLFSFFKNTGTVDFDHHIKLVLRLYKKNKKKEEREAGKEGGRKGREGEREEERQEGNRISQI